MTESTCVDQYTQDASWSPLTAIFGGVLGGIKGPRVRNQRKLVFGWHFKNCSTHRLIEETFLPG